MTDIPVVIVGGGLSGVSVAYHLANHGVDSILLEAGTIGQGSAAFPGGTKNVLTPPHVKMSLTPLEELLASISYLIGYDNTQLAVDFAREGVDLQKSIADTLGADIFRQHGSVILATSLDSQVITREAQDYRRFGIPFEEITRSEIEAMYPNICSLFNKGVKFSQDGLVDAQAYVKGMLERAQDSNKGKSTAYQNAQVLRIDQEGNEVKVTVQIGSTKDTITADHAVVATNAFLEGSIRDFMSPCWSFMVTFADPGANTPGTITNFRQAYSYQDFTRQDNVLAIGGGNYNTNYSRYGLRETISEKNQEKIRNLIAWAYQTFPHLRRQSPLETHQGMYALTNDRLPIVGAFPHDRVFYIVGCNAVGQSLLTHSAFLLPGIMGYRDLSFQEQEYARILSPRRRSLERNP